LGGEGGEEGAAGGKREAMGFQKRASAGGIEKANVRGNGTLPRMEKKKWKVRYEGGVWLSKKPCQGIRNQRRRLR